MGGAGGRVPPETSGQEISANLPGEKRQARKEGKMEQKRRKIKKKGRWKIERKWKEESYKMRRGLFIFLLFFLSFFLFFFFFWLFTFRTTEICFGSTKMGIFYQEKAFHARKKIRKTWLCPLWKIFLLRPWFSWWIQKKMGNKSFKLENFWKQLCERVKSY